MDNKKFSERRRKAYKFNVIDFALIVIIAAAVSILVYVMLGNNIFGGKENTIILYTIEIEVINNEFIPNINKIDPGTKIIESSRIYEIGEVQKVTITDAYVHTPDLETGVVSLKPYPEHSKVIITVKANCVKDKFKYTINGRPIMTGILIDFRTPFFMNHGYCTSIVEIDEDGSKITGANENEPGGNTEGE